MLNAILDVITERNLGFAESSNVNVLSGDSFEMLYMYTNPSMNTN